MQTTIQKAIKIGELVLRYRTSYELWKKVGRNRNWGGQSGRMSFNLSLPSQRTLRLEGCAPM